MKSMIRFVSKGLVAAVIMFFAFACLRFGSLSEAIAFYRGHELQLTPSRIEIDRALLDSSNTAEVSCIVKNLSFHEIELYGTTACCDFAHVKGVPSVLKPLESKELVFRVAINAAEPFNREVKVFTTSRYIPELLVQATISSASDLR